MDKKYKVTQEFMDTLVEWRDAYCLETKAGYIIDDSYKHMPTDVYNWAYHHEDAILRWLKGADVLEVWDQGKDLIRLPDETIEWLNNLEFHDVYDLICGVLDDETGQYLDYMKEFSSEKEAIDTLAEWYLGYVDFVSNKESRFYVVTDLGTLDTLGEHGETPTGFWTLNFLQGHGHYYMFTESDADDLVDGLSALNARKVKVEE